MKITAEAWTTTVASGDTLGDWRLGIASLIEKYGEDAVLHINEEDSGPEVYVAYERDETPDEVARREREAHYKEQLERQEFDRLRLKFGGSA